VTGGQLYAAAATLSRRIRATVPEQRVGIVLPPGAGAFIANLAVLAAGKTPVNLNFTTSRSGLEASFKLGGIATLISAEAMRAKLPNFPWIERTLDLKAEIAACGGKRAMLPWLLAAWVLPNQWCADLLGLPKEGDRAEAGLLFTERKFRRAEGRGAFAPQYPRELRADFVALDLAGKLSTACVPARLPQLRFHGDSVVSDASGLRCGHGAESARYAQNHRGNPR